MRVLPFRVEVLREEIRSSVPPEDQLSTGFTGRFMLTLFPRQSRSIPVPRKQRQHESSSKASRQLVFWWT
ncbi:unnamed protein product [Protopolystoma xenopodis]|uniref:Uncharacterized protein n=1 Tax=Protopolystoma xenopodis TaxID=117903 RepID=A0A3S5BCN1_9PLAT|nr:unnamed protein product [Protopolystoma xenopodis]